MSEAEKSGEQTKIQESTECTYKGIMTDTSEYISKREQKYLTQGEFMNATVDGKGGLSLGESVPESDKSSAALQGFLREDFVAMLQKSN